MIARLITIVMLVFGLLAVAAPAQGYGLVYTAIVEGCTVLGGGDPTAACLYNTEGCTGVVDVECSDPRAPDHWEHCDVWLPNNCF